MSQSNIIYPSPAGSDQQVQFNDGGTEGASANFVFDKTTSTLSVLNEVVTSLVGTGTRWVVTDATGKLTAQAIAPINSSLAVSGNTTGSNNLTVTIGTLNFTLHLNSTSGFTEFGMSSTTTGTQQTNGSWTVFSGSTCTTAGGAVVVAANNVYTVVISNVGTNTVPSTFQGTITVGLTNSQIYSFGGCVVNSGTGKLWVNKVK